MDPKCVEECEVSADAVFKMLLTGFMVVAFLMVLGVFLSGIASFMTCVFISAGIFVIMTCGSITGGVIYKTSCLINCVENKVCEVNSVKEREESKEDVDYVPDNCG